MECCVDGAVDSALASDPLRIFKVLRRVLAAHGINTLYSRPAGRPAQARSAPDSGAFRACIGAERA